MSDLHFNCDGCGEEYTVGSSEEKYLKFVIYCPDCYQLRKRQINSYMKLQFALKIDQKFTCNNPGVYVLAGKLRDGVRRDDRSDDGGDQTKVR